jgi:FkbH-like protein
MEFIMNKQKIKCVIWDLDNTIWEGVLLEDKKVLLKVDAVKTILELDRRGILQSISSKNNYNDAKMKLMEFAIWDYFIYPQINWNAKSNSVAEIAKNINIGMDTLAFIDDQQFEREEVNFSHPEVLCIDAMCTAGILDMDRMNPKYITGDSKNRRKMYQNDIQRNQVEKEFTGTKEEFLKRLNMVLRINPARVEDLQRAEELTVRTHQLNSTGYVYSYDELKTFIEADNYEVLIAGLDDRFGEYGKIGLALIEKKKDIWELKLLLMSCRVMSKGVGNLLMNYIINEAKKNHVVLQAQFVPTDRNKMMYITYKFNGFKEVEKDGDIIIFAADMSFERPLPDYVKIVTEGGINDGILINS